MRPTSRPIARAPTLLLWLFGLLFTGIALLLVIALTGRVWGLTLGTPTVLARDQTVTAMAPVALQAEGPASTTHTGSNPEAHARAEDDASKDVIANAMSALGVVLAAVTFLLSMGTTWFAQQHARFEKDLRRLEERDYLDEREAVQTVALLRAKRELAAWLGGRTTRLSGDDRLTQWGLALEALRANDRELRLQAFYDLQAALRTHAPQLREVGRYCEMCHDLARTRLQYDRDQRRRTPHEIQSDIDMGLWCLIFDPIEIERMMDSINKPPR